MEVKSHADRAAALPLFWKKWVAYRAQMDVVLGSPKLIQQYEAELNLPRGPTLFARIAEILTGKYLAMAEQLSINSPQGMPKS